MLFVLGSAGAISYGPVLKAKLENCVSLNLILLLKATEYYLIQLFILSQFMLTFSICSFVGARFIGTKILLCLFTVRNENTICEHFI